MSSTWTNFSVGPQDDGLHALSEDVPACASCRKRKLRCSRERPLCSHCDRLEIPCLYEAKQKPGLKSGLADRLAILEKILLDDAGNVRAQFNSCEDSTKQKYGERNRQKRNDTSDYQSPSEEISHQPENIKTPVMSNSNDAVNLNPRKRKLDSPTFPGSFTDMDISDILAYLPPKSLLLNLVDHFTVSFHHWIPYVHKARLRINVCGASSQTPLLLHSLVAVTLRHVSSEAVFMDEEQIMYQMRISRHIVESYALKTVSLECLQALIMLVFDYLNNGQPGKAWPLIGSLTRTVDYLQLTLEPTATSQHGALMNPLMLVPSTEDWTALEERRRLFWVIFLLDRFCSVSTGWNTSLTSEDVHRRLPADGGYFTREEPVSTPYFGIWNKSSARIGRSLANVPAQYNEDDPAVVQGQGQGLSPGSSNGAIDSSKLGAFAYCIEATESLSQVTTFFLQQRVNWQDKEHAVSWLTRFKELDLRLVHWKLFLPPRWKDSNISSDTEIVNMDPNLTLAHITHNTSMILLHHPIAHPAKGWKDYVALPKECSAQTCELAAVETSNIVEKFLAHQLVFVNAQFAFCTYVAAKALLFDHQVTKKPIQPEVSKLIQSLWEMAARWAGKSSQLGNNPSTTQAGIYASYLEYLSSSFERDPRFTFDMYDHSCRRSESPSPGPVLEQQLCLKDSEPFLNVNKAHVRDLSHQYPRNASGVSVHSKVPRTITVTSPSNNQYHEQSPHEISPTSHFIDQASQIALNGALSHMTPATVLPASPYQDIPVVPMNGTENLTQDESLLSLSDAFMDSHFLGMDRVITFEDANFFLPGDAFRWQ